MKKGCGWKDRTWGDFSVFLVTKEVGAHICCFYLEWALKCLKFGKDMCECVSAGGEGYYFETYLVLYFL